MYAEGSSYSVVLPIHTCLYVLQYAVLVNAVDCVRLLGEHFPATLDQRTVPACDTVLHLALQQGSVEVRTRINWLGEFFF